MIYYTSKYVVLIIIGIIIMHVTMYAFIMIFVQQKHYTHWRVCFCSESFVSVLKNFLNHYEKYEKQNSTMCAGLGRIVQQTKVLLGRFGNEVSGCGEARWRRLRQTDLKPAINNYEGRVTIAASSWTLRHANFSSAGTICHGSLGGGGGGVLGQR